MVKGCAGGPRKQGLHWVQSGSGGGSSFRRRRDKSPTCHRQAQHTWRKCTLPTPRPPVLKMGGTRASVFLSPVCSSSRPFSALLWPRAQELIPCPASSCWLLPTAGPRSSVLCRSRARGLCQGLSFPAGGQGFQLLWTLHSWTQADMGGRDQAHPRPQERVGAAVVAGFPGLLCTSSLRSGQERGSGVLDQHLTSSSTGTEI